MKKYLILSMLLLAAISLSAQGWERTYAMPTTPGWGPGFKGHDVIQTSDGGYLLVGDISYYSGAIRDYIGAVKTNAYGMPQWTKAYNNNLAVGIERGRSVVELPTGGYIIAGNNQAAAYLMRINSLGDTVWTKQYGLPCMPASPASCIATGSKVRATNDGNYIFLAHIGEGAGSQFNQSFLIKINPQGDTLWTKLHTGSFWNDMQPTPEGGYIAVGQTSSSVVQLVKMNSTGDTIWTEANPLWSATGTKVTSITVAADSGYAITGSLGGFAGWSPFLLRTDKNGNELWTAPSMSIGNNLGNAQQVVQTSDGNFVVTGDAYVTHGGALAVMVDAAYVAKYDDTGQNLWFRLIYDLDNNAGMGLKETSDDGLIIGGYRGENGCMIKMDSAGNSITSHIQGAVYRDVNYDCLATAGEDSLAYWTVQITDGYGNVAWTTTNSDGVYDFLVDTGSYWVKVIPPNNYWQLCPDSQQVVFNTTYSRDTIDFGAQALFNCPFLSVDVSTPFLRRCMNNIYTVQYCNTGTIDEPNAVVTIDLDTALTYTSSSIPLTSQSGNTLTFNVGNIPYNDCGTFTIMASLSCDTSIINQTHCTEATISPDTLCATSNPLWDGSDIDVSARCAGDSIYFTITNVGTGDMSTSLQYFVLEDHIMMMTNSFQLLAGESIGISFYANGKTYRLEAQQAAYHPVGNSPSIMVEACIATGLTNSVSTGFITQYAEDDASPSVSIDCQPNIGSWDPNDKRGFPMGYGVDHFINKNQDIEYIIRFQNTGTDTAFNVRIVDQLSQYLDPTDLQMGASSHPYTWTFQGNGEIEISFDNIMLPDSNVNEAASHGFVKFRIAQQVNNPVGTTIYNQVGIYFDFNPAVLTNTTVHKIGENFIILSLEQPEKLDENQVQVRAYPNPFSEQTTIEVLGNNYQELQLNVYDITGKVALERHSTGNKIQLQRGNLPQGVYIYRLEGDGSLLNTGKLIVR
ncbi:MAG: T9SS type A sorting domain-containing protein [Aureispira sp.]|nr:T9SS type A sorting domain-containing protein [Aureispira sp.]